MFCDQLAHLLEARRVGVHLQVRLSFVIQRQCPARLHVDVAARDGLQSLPKEPFEAAAIDGTTTWRVFRFLTLPMLRPVIVVCVVIRAIDAFRTFDIVWTLTGGGPGRSTELFSLYAYVHAFLNLDLGRGSAAAIIGGLIILVIGVVLYRLVDRIAKA